MGRSDGLRGLVRLRGRRCEGRVPALGRGARLARRARTAWAVRRGRLRPRERGVESRARGVSGGDGSVIVGANVAWYVDRAGGLTAFGLVTLSVVLGLLLSGRARSSWPRFALEDGHGVVG